MRNVLPSIALLLLLGCGRVPTIADIREYGEQRFVDEVLAVADGAEPSSSLLETFSPVRIEPHLGGA